ncbi:MAG: DNA photolyase family protein [Bacteroidetes bacterium]|nr:DNA photolyase family protein [Bacteroidota bacterium]
MSKPTISICWFRRDLRLFDQHAFAAALKGKNPVLPLFIFDKSILDKLSNKSDRRVQFIHESITAMDAELRTKGSGMMVRYGFPLDVFDELSRQFTIGEVYTNHDYEPYALERDEAVEKLLSTKGIAFHTFKDQVIFEKSEVVKDDGSPYTVYTPYSKKWKLLLAEKGIPDYSPQPYFSNLYQHNGYELPSLSSMGFEQTPTAFPSRQWDAEEVKQYGERRDYPALPGTSRLSVHLRFGTISIRQLVKQAMGLSEKFLNELIWRDFYHMILWHFPKVGKGASFKKEYDAIQWRNNESEFEKWCQGKTGYPIVDAGMRELNATGYMHNRVRMIVASFLTKHLLIDWRWGEAYFAAQLLDFDLAANNGGWQWAAGSGCDAAPYFRIFNPYLQTQKFDEQLTYIRQWVPELDSFDYPAPIVNHELARKRCLDAYAAALKPTTSITP